MPRNVSTAARGSGERRLSRNEPGHALAMLTSARTAAGVGRGCGSRGPAARRPLLDEPAEDRVGGVLRDALAERERQVAEVEVAGPPAEHRGVERDDDRVAARRLGPPDQALDQLVGRRPVQLEPARARRPWRRRTPPWAPTPGWRRPSARRGDAAARATARSASACTSSSAPTGPSSSGAGESPAEQLDGGVPAAHVPQHPGDDRPPVERRPVGALGGLVAGAARDIGVGAGVQRLLRPLLERAGGGRDPGAVAVHTRAVDLVLPSTAGACFVHALLLCQAACGRGAAAVWSVGRSRLKTTRARRRLRARSASIVVSPWVRRRW